MAELIIDKFHVGLVTHPSETALKPGAALKAEDVEFSALGRLKSRKGHLLSLAGPAGITMIGDPFKYEFNLPGSFGRKEVIFVYGQDGSSRDTLWWRPYWDTITAAWIDGWQELTEFEGPLTMDAGTTATNVRDAALAVATSDYYNTWLLLNITRQKSMVVFDYVVGATQDLTLHGFGVVGQTTGDKYMLYRFPLIMSLEGPYAADTNTTTTSLVDSELRSEAEEHYTGWKLNNTTRGIEVTVTSYDGKNKTLTHPVITGQVATDSYYIYKETHSIRADVVRFFPRQNAIEISLGNDESYPLKAPLWFGFITKREYLSKTVLEDTTFEGFWFARNVMQSPDVSVVSAVDGSGGTLADDTYYFKASYLFDGYQESPLSDSVSLDPTGTNEIDLDFHIPLYFSDSTNKTGVFDAMLDRRITHVRMYAAKGDSDDADDNYFLFISMPVVNIALPKNGKQNWTQIAGVYQQIGFFAFNDDRWANGIFTETVTDKIVFGKFLRWDHNQGHKSESVDANFKFKTDLEEQHYKAPIFTDEKRDAFVGYSVQANGNGVPVDDVIPLENFLNLVQKGIVEITGLTTIRGFLVILTPNKIFIYAPGRSLTDFPVERGNIAERGFITVDDTLYFSASDDFYAFDARSVPKKLMFGKILDQWQAISDTNKQSAFVGYSKKTDSIFLVVAGTIFVYDRIFDAWRTHTTDVTFIGFTTRRDGVLFAATSSNIYELQSDSFTEVITTDWESRVMDFTKELGESRLPIAADVNKVIMKYGGDKRIKVSLFDPSQSNVYPMATVVFFPIASNIKPKPVPRVVSFEANQLKVKIEDIDPGTSQPSSEIDYLRIEYEPISGEF